MVMRTSFDPNGIGATEVDKVLGTAYEVVEAVYTKLPAIQYLAENIDGLTEQATGSKDAAALSAAAAALDAAAAATSASLADNDRLASQEAAESAQENANLAEASRVNAGESETLAQSWADLIGAPVTPGLYSAKEWATGAETRGDAGGGSAKDWANYVGGTVDATEYSAKKYAQDSAASLSAAEQAVVDAEAAVTEAQLTVPPVQVADYTALRVITGAATRVDVTGYLVSAAPSGIAGTFVRDDTDTTSTDNGGTVIVVTSGPNTGKRFKRSYTGAINPIWFTPLVTGTGATENWSAALQAALDASLNINIPYRVLGYRCPTPVNLRSGHRITGNGAKIFRNDQLDHLLQIIDKSDIVIQGLSFSHSYNMVGDRSNKSAVYGLRSSKVTVTNCDFNDIGLFAVSSDISGDNWTVVGNRFYKIAGTAYDARGGFNHLVAGNIIVETGDDAIDVANTPGGWSKRTVVANNIIVRAGQIHTGGGGIRVNSFGVTVSGNQFYDANMYFVVVAALSTDGSMRPDHTIVTGNVGYGIKPTTNNTTGCVLIKNSGTTQVFGNSFDPRGDKDIAITNVTDNGSGKCRFTAANHGYTTNNVVRVEGVVGVTAANGSGAVTVIDANTFDISTLTFSGAYTSGGVAFCAIVGVRAYSGDNTPTQNEKLILNRNRFANVENLLRVQNLGLNRVVIEDNEVLNYQSVTQMQDTSVMAELILKRNNLRNGKTALFSGTSTVSLTRLTIHDNVCVPLLTTDVPIQFGNAVIAKADILRNKLGCGATQFNGAGSVAEMFYDGDHSGRRHNQGTGTITSGQTAAASVTHGCTLGDGTSVQPKTGEITMSLAQAANVAALVQATEVFSTTFVPRTTPAAPANIDFVWRLAPVVQRYVNGVLA